MASSDATRWHLSCDRCDAAAWIGPHAGGAEDAFCEGCQRPARLEPALAGESPACPACGAPLTLGAPRFTELPGELQQLDAVLAAWNGAPGSLRTLLPERPRFPGDLTPVPPAADDPPEVAAVLARLAAGDARGASAPLVAAARAQGSGRLARAAAIAAARVGDAAAAEALWSEALGFEESDVARLNRGAARARRGDFAGAGADLERAGDSPAARWNRAALRVCEAVSATPGLPAPERLAEARAEAGAPSDYWSDFTIGRLLWTLLLERARGDAGAAGATDLRAAEAQFEFDTFWDIALRLAGYAALGLAADAARTAAPLAGASLKRLLAEPYARAAGPIRDALASAERAVAADEPAAAAGAIQALRANPQIARYRLPCVRCGTGALGVDEVEEGEGAGD